jgi:hypothetical protein
MTTVQPTASSVNPRARAFPLYASDALGSDVPSAILVRLTDGKAHVLRLYAADGLTIPEEYARVIGVLAANDGYYPAEMVEQDLRPLSVPALGCVFQRALRHDRIYGEAAYPEFQRVLSFALTEFVPYLADSAASAIDQSDLDDFRDYVAELQLCDVEFDGIVADGSASDRPMTVWERDIEPLGDDETVELAAGWTHRYECVGSRFHGEMLRIVGPMRPFADASDCDLLCHLVVLMFMWGVAVDLLPKSSLDNFEPRYMIGIAVMLGEIYLGNVIEARIRAWFARWDAARRAERA